jgi:hypothetical protein
VGSGQPDHGLITVSLGSHVFRHPPLESPCASQLVPLASGPHHTGRRQGRPLPLPVPFKLPITSDGPAVNGPPCAIQRQINLFATPWGDKGIDSGKFCCARDLVR